MTRRWCVLVAVVLAVGVWSSSAGVAYHGVGASPCEADGSSPNVLDDDAKVIRSVLTSDHAGETWSFALGEGEHYLVAASTFDINLTVCKVGTTIHACRSGNGYPLYPETCLIAIENPQSGTPLLGPGTFRLDVVNCGASTCHDYPPDLEMAVDYLVVVS